MFKTSPERDTAIFWKRVEKTDGCWNYTGPQDQYGYGRANINEKRHLAHRMSWFLAYGAWPTKNLDHICRNRLCVRPEHLREVTQAQNMQNLPVTSTRSASGYRGVTWDKRNQKWRAQLMHNRRMVHVGRFATVPEALTAVQEARRRLQTHNNLDR